MNFEVRSLRVLIILLVVANSFLSGCSDKKTEIIWEKSIYRIGSQSSPRFTDLNGDDILDIVIGAGKNEYEYTEQGILAINGATGDILWQQETEDQVFGSATFLDVTNDGVDEIFIGGRSPNFRCIDGKTGSLIWRYNYQFDDDPVLKYAKFNFYNSVIVPDQDGDGVADLLVLNGGNSKAQAYDTLDRYPGVLMIMSSKSGKVIAADTMPDGNESYMSPVVYQQPDSPKINIIFGTGGETLDGSLYLTTLDDLKLGNLAKARVLTSETGHGYISPPAIVDLNLDGYYDVVNISHGSHVVALDGKSLNVMWEMEVEDTECSSSFAVGHFNEDDYPDLFINVAKGIWPNSTTALQLMFNGLTGEIEYQDSLGCTGFSSPVVYDLNHDGIDEVIQSVNEFDCSLGFTKQENKDILHRLVYFDFKANSAITIDQGNGFKNFFSTPGIADLDADDYLDIVYCQYYNASVDPLLFLGMTIKRISTDRKIKKPVVWGAYMGSKGNGIYDQ